MDISRHASVCSRPAAVRLGQCGSLIIPFMGKGCGGYSERDEPRAFRRFEHVVIDTRRCGGINNAASRWTAPGKGYLQCAENNAMSIKHSKSPTTFRVNIRAKVYLFIILLFFSAEPSATIVWPPKISKREWYLF